jgi:hypothetical protein
VKDRERERLERTIVKQEDAIFRQSAYILRLHGGEVYVRGGREKRRGRPRGSSDVSAAALLAAHRELHVATGRHVAQAALAERIDKTVEGLKYLLKLYGLDWPLD